VRKHNSLAFLVVTAVLTAACGAPPRYIGQGMGPAPEPLRGAAEGAGSIHVSAVTSVVPTGVEIGGRFDDDTSMRIRLSNVSAFPWDQELKCWSVEVVSEELARRGFNARRGNECADFKGVAPASSTADFHLSGVVDNISLNGFNRPGRSDAEVIIAWELLRTRDRQVVFRERFYGGSSIAGNPDHVWSHAVGGAVVQSLHRLLASPSFLRELRAAGRVTAAATTLPDPAPGAQTLRYGNVPASDIIEIAARQRRPAAEGSPTARALSAVITIVTSTGTGSGFVVASDGLAISNAHVVGSARSVAVRFGDGREVTAYVIRRDTLSDLALLEFPCSACTTLGISATEPELGSEVLLIGSARGLAGSVTRGIVSSRRLLNGVTYLQTDAAANPGNSGGPLVSLSTEEAVGVLTFGLRDSEGMAFAASAIDAMRVLGLRYGR
jgi:serine protease Do